MMIGHKKQAKRNCVGRQYTNLLSEWILKISLIMDCLFRNEKLSYFYY